MTKIRIGVVQLRSMEGETIGTALDEVSTVVADLASDTDLVILPEIWTPGYFAFDGYAAAAESSDQILTRLADLARDGGIHLHGGSIVIEEDGLLYNTSHLFDPDGSQLATYRKTHLFGYGSREPEMLTPGPGPTVVDTELGPIGMAVCYDLRYPDLFRVMVDRGTELLLVASAWPLPRVDAWRTLSRARAIETQTFLVAANGAGPTPSGPTLCGHSAVIDPWGTTVAAAGDDPTTFVTTIDTDEVTAARDRFRQLADRRSFDHNEPTLSLTRPGTRPLRFQPERILVAGYTGRDTDAVAAYVESLAAKGIEPPEETPMVFRCGRDRLVTHYEIEVLGDETCGEIEFVLLVSEEGTYVTVGSDHTDRLLEEDSIAVSKQVTPKVVATDVWPLDDVVDHWDDLILRSWVGDTELGPYQETGVDFFMDLDTLFTHLDDPTRPGTVIFGGSVSSLKGGFDFSPVFRGELHDPVLDRSIFFEYRTTDMTEGSSEGPT